MCVKIYYTILLAVCGILTETTFLPEFQQHKKIIIRVPVIKHTVYKYVNKGHKHHGEVIHHHHHDGHVAHVHKHEGEAHHKHHHHGMADHHHKHVGSGDHKHMHSGKAEHGHSHKGHFSNNHHHKGHHGHDHKHKGMFSNMHAHSGKGSHSHGHHGIGYHGHSHGYLNHLTHGYGSMMDPNGVAYFNDEYAAAMVGTHVPHYQQHRPNDGLFAPSPEIAPPMPFSGFSYFPENDARYRSGTPHGYASSYVPENINQPSFDKVKIAAVPSTFLTAPQESNEFGDDTKSYKAGYKVKSPMFNLFTPEETAEIENSLNSGEDFDESKESASSEFRNNDIEPGSYDEEELEDGAFQPVKTRVHFPKIRTKQKLIAPLVQYEVTENPPLI